MVSWFGLLTFTAEGRGGVGEVRSHKTHGAARKQTNKKLEKTKQNKTLTHRAMQPSSFRTFHPAKKPHQQSLSIPLCPQPPTRANLLPDPIYLLILGVSDKAKHTTQSSSLTIFFHLAPMLQPVSVLHFFLSHNAIPHYYALISGQTSELFRCHE